jgi:rare lipoprotein A
VRARANRYVASLLAAGVGVLAAPALAAAGSGGASMGSAGASTGTSSAPTPTAQPGNLTVSATADGITLQTNASAFMRSGVSVTGSVPAADAGDAVEIDQLPAGASSAQPSWTAVAVVDPRSNGSFAASWKTAHPGQVTIRAVLQGSQASSATAAPPSVSLTVYRRSIATLYGPGFWGHRTACGVILRRRTIGVANRTLPCGTEVQLYYEGSVLTVPVIDRGPYAHGANWDLTMATGRALGMLGTATIGAAALSSSTSTAGGTSSTGTVPSAQ